MLHLTWRQGHVPYSCSAPAAASPMHYLKPTLGSAWCQDVSLRTWKRVKSLLLLCCTGRRTGGKLCLRMSQTTLQVWHQSWELLAEHSRGLKGGALLALKNPILKQGCTFHFSAGYFPFQFTDTLYCFKGEVYMRTKKFIRVWKKVNWNLNLHVLANFGFSFSMKKWLLTSTMETWDRQ